MFYAAQITLPGINGYYNKTLFIYTIFFYSVDVISGKIILEQSWNVAEGSKQFQLM